jgi:hypothetical protein
MTPPMRTRITYAVLTLGLTAVAGGACVSDTTDPGDREPAVAIMRLTVGNTQINVDQSGQVTGGQIVLRPGVASNVTAEFLSITGETLPGVTPAVYQVNAVASGSEPITFQRSNSNPFAGTITCNVPSVTAHMRFSLYNVEKQHDLWGPFDVAFVVSN